MIVYLARDIQAFVMYCVNGTSRSSLLIESTDSMIRTYMQTMHMYPKSAGFYVLTFSFEIVLYICEIIIINVTIFCSLFTVVCVGTIHVYIC